jgi:two-component system OmpR family response regulator
VTEHTSNIGSVLLVDDDLDTRRMYATAIALAGFTVQEAEDGREALAMATRSPPDLLVTDLVGPRLDGFELIGRLRADPRTAEIPVLVLSGRTEEWARQRASELAVTFVLKPCLPDTLIAHMVKVLTPADPPISDANARPDPARRDPPHSRLRNH